MDKKFMYWIIGGVAAVLIILFAVGIWGKRTGNGADTPTQQTAAGQASSEQTLTGQTSAHDHGQMPTQDSSFSGASTGEDMDPLTAYIADQDRIMMDMMEDMKLDSPSGNASVDFLMGMIPHHESAVAMAESLLKYGGENEEIKKLAEDIIDVQNKEIEEMNEMIEELSDDSLKDEEKEAAYLEEYNKMFDNPHAHHVDVSNAKSVDEAFAMGMIAHHQMAVDMARAIFEYTDSDRLKEMSQDIIEVQEQEIAQMQKLLKEMQAQ